MLPAISLADSAGVLPLGVAVPLAEGLAEGPAVGVCDSSVLVAMVS